MQTLHPSHHILFINQLVILKPSVSGCSSLSLPPSICTSNLSLSHSSSHCLHFALPPPHQPLLLQPHTQSNPTSPSYSSFSLPSLSLVSLLPASVYLSITDRKWDALVQRGQADGISVHYLTIYRTEGEHNEREKEEE